VNETRERTQPAREAPATSRSEADHNRHEENRREASPTQNGSASEADR